MVRLLIIFFIFFGQITLAQEIRFTGWKRAAGADTWISYLITEDRVQEVTVFIQYPENIVQYRVRTPCLNNGYTQIEGKWNVETWVYNSDTGTTVGCDGYEYSSDVKELEEFIGLPPELAYDIGLTRN